MEIWHVLILTVGIAIVAFFLFLVYKTSKQRVMRQYREIKSFLPLNCEIQVTVNREIMNDNFMKLSNEEMIILKKRVNLISLIREEGNSIKAIYYDEKNERNSYKLCNPQSKNCIVKYFNKGYFAIKKTK